MFLNNATNNYIRKCKTNLQVSTYTNFLHKTQIALFSVRVQRSGFFGYILQKYLTHNESAKFLVYFGRYIKNML